MQELIRQLKETPETGTSIGYGCYKIRLAIASKVKGKSGGARVKTHVIFKDGTVYLLTIYDKSDIESLSDKEVLELIKHIP